MTEQPLHQQLGALLSELDRLRQRHDDAQDYAAASERLAFVLDRVLQLQSALDDLREATQRLREAGDPDGDAIWASTREELRRLAPGPLRLAAAPLRSANLDLLRLVEYTGAASCLLVERRATLERRLAERATAAPGPAPASDGSSCGAPAD